MHSVTPRLRPLPPPFHAAQPSAPLLFPPLFYSPLLTLISLSLLLLLLLRSAPVSQVHQPTNQTVFPPTGDHTCPSFLAKISHSVKCFVRPLLLLFVGSTVPLTQVDKEATPSPLSRDKGSPQNNRTAANIRISNQPIRLAQDSKAAVTENKAEPARIR